MPIHDLYKEKGKCKEVSQHNSIAYQAHLASALWLTSMSSSYTFHENEVRQTVKHALCKNALHAAYAYSGWLRCPGAYTRPGENEARQTEARVA